MLEICVCPGLFERDLAAIQDHDSIGERHHFVEVLADEKDRLAAVPSLIEQGMHCFDCADVETSRG